MKNINFKLTENLEPPEEDEPTEAELLKESNDVIGHEIMLLCESLINSCEEQIETDFMDDYEKKKETMINAIAIKLIIDNSITGWKNINYSYELSKKLEVS